MPIVTKEIKVNEAIRAKEVRVISSEGEQLGIVPVRDAINIAIQAGLDLVEVAPDATPPVCRIMDFGKYKYIQGKRVKEARKKQTTIQIKEVKMGPKTEEHDFQFKARHVKRFLEDGNKAKITIRFRGREIAHTDLGKKMLERMIKEMSDISAIEQPPRFEGKNLVMVLSPKS